MTVRIALLIDSPPDAPYHRATMGAIGHAAGARGVPLDLTVHTTDALPFDDGLTGLDGVVIGPGTPYRDEAAAWVVIRRARERGVPLVAT